MLAKTSVDQALTKAKIHIRKNEIQEAQKLYKSILVAFPKNKRVQNALSALKCLNLNYMIKKQPQEAFNKIIDQYKKREYSNVIDQLKVFIKHYPNEFIAWNLIGSSAFQIGMFNEAIEAFSKALLIKPDYPEALNNMGNALKEQGELDKAIEVYRKCIMLKSNCTADCYNNMGVALKDKGKLEDALEAFNKAIKLRHDHTAAYNNISIILKGMIFTKSNPGLYNSIITLLEKKSNVRPRNIVKSVISLLKLDPKLSFYLQRICKDKVKLPIKKVVINLSELTLLLELMSVCPIADIEMEYLLASIRANILFEIPYLKKTPEILKFQSALSLNCFINEYIYNQSKNENKALKELEGLVKLSLDNNLQPSPQFILCLASYKPLNHYGWYDKLVVSSEIEDVFTRQVVESKQENNLKSKLPTLKEIEGEISLKVKEQYESNPYPRWVNLGLPIQHKNISKIFKNKNLKLFNNRIKEVKDPSILVAGCGTGQHSLDTAIRFKKSKIVAIDLSLSSLAYAKRKTQELNVQNIEYIQADILDLHKLHKQFDIIESVGVLHHMKDPFEGWKVLVNCLKPGGLMRIGLYSELARQHVVKLRKEILDKGIKSKDVDMKLLRFNLINSQKKHHIQTQNSNDFYSLSEFRDLLFHVQEHRFTIPQIKGLLNDLGLKFCGFEAENINSQFKLTNIDKEDMYNLDKWHVFEKANNMAFEGMYQFWCQKPELKERIKLNKRQLSTTSTRL